ncbi:hypothetical protein Tco_1150534 [Tanacetum coccineum]
MRGFLWCQVELKKCKAKVTWELVYKPKLEGGLGNLKPFSVAYAWDFVWLRADVVDWYHLVWFPQCILRHAFYLWCGLRFVVSLVWIKSPRFANISAYLIPSSKGTSVVSIISRLLLGAISYYIWSERNSRLFKKKVFTVPQIVQVITSMVRLKLVTFKFKKVSTWFCLLLDQWKIPSCCLVHEESSG